MTHIPSKSVLIVGAGPVGLTLAIELTRFGIPVRIVDKAAERTDKSKALVLWSRTLELLDRQPGGAATFIDAGFKVNAVSFLSGDKFIGRVTMDSVATDYPYALMIPQAETERLLEERLASLGVKVQRNTEAVSLSLRDDGADAVLRLPDGNEENVSADWLIGCDGAHSLVRHTVGATFDGKTMDSDWILADVHMRGYPVSDTEATVYWHQDGAFVIFPISPGRYRLLADLPSSGEARPPAPTLEQVQTLIDRRGPQGMTAFDPIWLAGFRINGRKVTRYRWGRAFLCGDAAHVHSPAGGQGMNTGMQDAFNLAWKLALFAHGHATEALLDSFSPERSYVGDQVLKNAERLTLVGTTRNPVVRTVRDVVGHVMLGVASVQNRFADTMTETTIGYPDSPLNAGSASGLDGPEPGQRILGDRPFGAGNGPRFTLLGSGAAAAALIGRYPNVLDAELRSPPDPNGVWLVRPDGYVAAVATHDDLSAIENSLARLTA
ncbi:FAD-dependent monooxygenase [Burkholderia dolosa]|uniref:FAD-dependent monooxygenase n=1 Tax=Burkholderia dolosa TaxID=152500 RepID=UPI0015912A72|nr:FAD-dependent monooxygenase [Burkholderia dolosa]MBY4752985.1 FAD-dependent monooxygenase [Burkholderia dolosa]